MRDTYKDLVVGCRARLIEYYRERVAEAKTEEEPTLRAFAKGMIAGLKLGVLQMRWLHHAIRNKEAQGYTLVWLSVQEREILQTWNPGGGFDE